MIEWLVDTLLATSALIGLVLVLREPVRRRFGASVAYALWLLPVLRLGTPPVARTVERIVPAAEPAQLTLAAFGNGGGGGPAIPSSPSLFAQAGGWTGLMIGAWLVGAAVMLGRGLLQYRRQRAAALGEGTQLARIGSIRLVRSHAVNGPIAFGLLDRVIAVPADFDRRFDDAQRRLALAHELSHHRSGDILANHFAFVLLCLQWFNPLAWAAHSAFRFDQEAACDARVLDKVHANDRAVYGRAIAKAASGRALLFASALDRPHTLKRRLETMTMTPSARRRRTGQLLVGAAILVALPLTATKAVRYIDVPAAPAAPAAPVAPVAPAAPVALPAAVSAIAPVVPPAPPTPPAPPAPVVAPDAPVSPAAADISFVGENEVRIHGRTKRWNELTPAERADIRRETAKARAELDRQRARLPEELANARREVDRMRKGEFRREMAEARVEIHRALAELDAHAAAIRATGQDPEQLKAQVRASLAEVEKMDIDKMVREAMANVDPGRIAGELSHAKESLARVEARLDALDRDQRQ